MKRILLLASLVAAAAISVSADSLSAERLARIDRLFQQYVDGGGELLVCPICFNARKLDEGSLVANARLAGATPLWEWIGDEHASVFSY